MARQQRSPKPATRRTYTMTQRQAAVDETRARIVDAAIGLYETVGPAKTTMSAVADRAGVTRATLYRHFSSDEALADAALAAWREGWTGLDEQSLSAVNDPDRRLRAGLAALYQGYRTTEDMTANLVRDSHALPVQHRDAARGPAAIVVRIAGTPVSVRGRAASASGSAAAATVAHAAAFETWQSLRRAGLGDAAIVELMARLVGIAGSVEPGTPDAAGGAAPRTRAGSDTAGTWTAPPGRKRATADASTPTAANRRPQPTAPDTAASGPAARTRAVAADTTAIAPEGRRTRAAAPSSSHPAASSAPSAARAPENAAKAEKPAKAGKGKAGKKGKGDRKAERKAKGGAGRGA